MNREERETNDKNRMRIKERKEKYVSKNIENLKEKMAEPIVVALVVAVMSFSL